MATTRLAEHFVDGVVHVPVHPQGGLVPCDQAIEVGGEGRIQRAVGVPGLHAARARRVVGDDDWGQTGVVRLAQLRFDERAVFGVPERRLARGEQSARCAAVSDSRR